MASEHTIRPETLKRENRPLVFALIAIIVGGLAGLLVLNISNPALLAALLLGTAVVAAMTAKPEFGLAVLSFVTYTATPDVLSRTQGLPSLVWPLVGVLMLAVLVRRIMSVRAKPFPFRPVMLIVLYVGVCLVSLAWTRDPDRTGFALMMLFQATLIAITMLILLETPDGLRMVMWSLLASAMFLGTLSVHQFLTGNFGSEYWGFARAEYRQIAGEVHSYRVTGPLGDANFFSQILLVILPVAAERFLHERKMWLRAAALYAFGATALCIVFAFSRGAFLSMMMVAGLVMLRYRVRFVHWLLLFGAGAILLLFIPSEYFLRIKSLIDAIRGVQGPLDRALTSRVTEVMAAWRMFLDHPILGVGFGNYNVFYQEYARQSIDPTLMDRSAHCMYLQIAAETGLCGVFIIGTLLWMVVRGLQRSIVVFKTIGKTQEAGMVSAFLLGILAYLAAGLFLHVAYPKMLWLLIGIALSIPLVARNELQIAQTQKEMHE